MPHHDRAALQVGGVLLQHRQRPLSIHQRAVARDHVIAALDQRSQALQRLGVGVDAAVLVQVRDLDRGQVVADHQHPRPPDQHRHPVLGVPAGGVQLELPVGDVQPARHRQRLQRAERERRGALDHQFFVELAQPSLGLPRPGFQARDGALRAPQRQPRERQAPEQVVPVAVGGEQPARLREAGLAQQPRQRVELFREHRRVDHEHLRLACGLLQLGPHHHAVERQHGAGHEQDVGVEGLRPHPPLRWRRAAWPPL